MKYSTPFILILSAMFAHAGIVAFFTKSSQDWTFIQSVGGMKVLMKDTELVVECNVSGTKKVTVEPTVINSALGVSKLKHKREGNTIKLTLVTCLIEKGISTSPKPIDLSKYPDGDYTVEYMDPDGTKHPLGKVTVKRK